MRYTLTHIAWLPCFGCWLSDSEIAAQIGADQDSGGSDLEFHITDIDPPFGTTNGGNSVQIQLSTAIDNPTVHFGDAEALVESADGTSLTVWSPPNESEGYVDISVSSGAESDSTEDAFYYWKDGDGQTGAVGGVYWYHYQGVGWSADLQDDGQAYFRFVEPSEDDFYDSYAPSNESCVSDRNISFQAYPVDDPAPELIRSDGDAERMPPEGGYFYTDDLEWQAGESFDIEREEVEPWPELRLPDAVKWPTEPAYIDYPLVDIFVDPVPPDVYVEWSGSSSEKAVLLFSRYDGDDVVERVTCVVNDDGYYWVDEDVWGGWISDQYLVIQVGRVRLRDVELDYNESIFSVAGVHFSAGVAVTD